MATIGLPLLARSINEFKYENTNHSLDICGIVFNHSSTYSEGPEGKQSIREVQTEAKKNRWSIQYACPLLCFIPQRQNTREGTPIDKTSYVHFEVTTEFSKFVDEFLKSVGLS